MKMEGNEIKLVNNFISLLLYSLLRCLTTPKNRKMTQFFQ